MDKKNAAIVLCLCCSLGGCSTVKKAPEAVIETARVLWGTSTKALEDSREKAISKDYNCEMSECFSAVLSLARNESLSPVYLGPSKMPKFHKEQTVTLASIGAMSDMEEKDTAQELTEDTERLYPSSAKKIFDIFLKDQKKGKIIVIGLQGSIETTEVGIFFSKVTENTNKVEVVSFSDEAQEKIASAIFDELDYRFAP